MATKRPKTRAESKNTDNEQVQKNIKSTKTEKQKLVEGINEGDSEDSDGIRTDNESGNEQVTADAKAKIDEVKDTQLKDCNTHLKNSYLNLYFIAIAVVMVVLIASKLLSEQGNERPAIDIQLKLDQLFQDFKNQSPRSAKKLRSRVLPYLNHTRSPQPLVLLVAAMQEDRLAADCFAARVGNIISSKPLIINGSLYSDDTGKKVKEDIDGKLRDTFKTGEFPTAAIIYNLNLLPYSTLELFYGFCDHDNPLYKEATIIFTVMLPPEYHSMSLTVDEIKKEGIVETYLQDEWSKDEMYNEDIIAALLSRISDTVIIVSEESEESLEKSCSTLQ